MSITGGKSRLQRPISFVDEIVSIGNVETAASGVRSIVVGSDNNDHGGAYNIRVGVGQVGTRAIDHLASLGWLSSLGINSSGTETMANGIMLGQGVATQGVNRHILLSLNNTELVTPSLKNIRVKINQSLSNTTSLNGSSTLSVMSPVTAGPFDPTTTQDIRNSTNHTCNGSALTVVIALASDSGTPLVGPDMTGGDVTISLYYNDGSYADYPITLAMLQAQPGTSNTATFNLGNELSANPVLIYGLTIGANNHDMIVLSSGGDVEVQYGQQSIGDDSSGCIFIATSDSNSIGYGCSQCVFIGSNATIAEQSSNTVLIGSRVNVGRDCTLDTAIGFLSSIAAYTSNSVAIGAAAGIGTASSSAISIGDNAQVGDHCDHSICLGDNSTIGVSGGFGADHNVNIGSSSSIADGKTYNVSVGANNSIKGSYNLRFGSGQVSVQAVDHLASIGWLSSLGINSSGSENMANGIMIGKGVATQGVNNHLLLSLNDAAMATPTLTSIRVKISQSLSNTTTLNSSSTLNVTSPVAIRSFDPTSVQDERTPTNQTCDGSSIIVTITLTSNSGTPLIGPNMTGGDIVVSLYYNDGSYTNYPITLAMLQAQPGTSNTATFNLGNELSSAPVLICGLTIGANNHDMIVLSTGSGNWSIGDDSDSSVFIGISSSIANTSSSTIIIGNDAHVGDHCDHSICLGNNTIGTTGGIGCSRNIAIGNSIVIDDITVEGIAIGYGVHIEAHSIASMAIGYGAGIGQHSADGIAIGYNTVLGSNCQDSILIGSKNSVQGMASSIILGTGITFSSAGLLSNVIIGNNILFGDGSFGLGVAIGGRITINAGGEGIAIGYGSTLDTNTYGIALGSGAKVSNTSAEFSSIAIGQYTLATDKECIIGDNRTLTYSPSSAINHFAVRGIIGVFTAGAQAIDTLSAIAEPVANYTGLTITYNDGATTSNKTIQAGIVGSLPAGAKVLFIV